MIHILKPWVLEDYLRNILGSITYTAIWVPLHDLWLGFALDEDDTILHETKTISLLGIELNIWIIDNQNMWAGHNRIMGDI